MAILFVRCLAVCLALAAVVADGRAPHAPPPVKHTKRSLTQTTTTKHNTNAKRFAAGLPPLRPRRLLSPSRVRRTPDSAVASASPSPSPSALSSVAKRAVPISRTGFIQVIDPNERKSLGYVSRSFTTGGQYVITQTLNSALEVTLAFDAQLSSSRLTSLEVTIPQEDRLPFIGLIASTSNQKPVKELGPSSTNHACLGMTAAASKPRTLAMNPMFHGADTASNSETAVWRFSHGASFESLTPVWTNPDGLRSETTLAYLQIDGTLCVVSDLSRAKLELGQHPVVLRLVPSE